VGLREQYQKILERKRVEAEALRAQLIAVEAYIEAMQDAIKLLPKEPNGEPFTAPIQTQLREGTKLAKVRESLLSKGKPLRINEILQDIGEPVTKEARVALSGSLGQYAKQGKIFKKTGPNIFGLLDYSDVSQTETEIQEKEEDAEDSTAPDIQSAEITEDDIPF